MKKLLLMLAPMLLSRGGRRMAGRNAGKAALAGIAWKLFQKARNGRAGGGYPRRRY